MTDTNKGEVWCVSVRIEGSDTWSKDEVMNYFEDRLQPITVPIDVQSVFNVKEALGKAGLEKYTTEEDE